MEFINLLKNRRSIRRYSGEKIEDEKLELILQAAFLVPMSRANLSWEAIVVRDKKVLDQMAGCRQGTVKMLKEADCAIVMLGNPAVSDVWTEDSVIALSSMHLTASVLGIGSCWIQGRNREACEGVTTEEYLREILDFPKDLKLEAILTLGMPGEKKEPHDLKEFPVKNIHLNRYSVL